MLWVGVGVGLLFGLLLCMPLGLVALKYYSFHKKQSVVVARDIIPSSSPQRQKEIRVPVSPPKGHAEPSVLTRPLSLLRTQHSGGESRPALPPLPPPSEEPSAPPQLPAVNP